MLFSVAGAAHAQEEFDNRSRAEYIFDILRYVSWPDEYSIDTFRIAVLDRDNGLYQELKKLAVSNKTHEKPVAVFQYDKISAIGEIQMLFVNRSSGFDIDLVAEKIRGRGILLISENFSFHKSMINFIVLEGKKRFEINEELLKEEGFTVTFAFAALAVKSKADWESLYFESEKQLRIQKLLVEQQQQKIEEQLSRIEALDRQILGLNEEILQKESKLGEQDKRMKSQQEQLELLHMEIVSRERLLKEKLRVLDSQNLAIADKNLKMSEQEKVLLKQSDEIQMQLETIEMQGSQIAGYLERIELLRIAIYLFITLLLMTFFLAYYIYRSYKIKKTANIKLEEKNRFITEQSLVIEKERDKSDKLLLNILPARVADDLKARGSTEPQLFTDVTVMFSDLVGFTKHSASMPPKDLISELNEIFTAFDQIAEKHSCERIKTMGDAYMAVCGLPAANPRHAENMLLASLEILSYLEDRNEKSSHQWNVRIGIHSGEVVGGVVGIKKYIYDIFGDTINTASRMESNAKPMTVNVSENTYLLLKNNYKFDMPRQADVKGKGLMNMYTCLETISYTR